MPPPVVMKRIGIAILIAVAIYAAMLAFGSALYATGVIGHGATHNDCVNFRADIAEERGIAEEDVPQAAVKAATEQCLSRHELTKWHAFRTEYLEWAAWPAVVVALIYLGWPLWAEALRRQELADPIADAPGLDLGS